MEDLQVAIEQLQAEGFWIIGPDLADIGDTIRLGENADYTVIKRGPKPNSVVGFARDPEQITIYAADPVTGEILSVRHVDPRRPFETGTSSCTCSRCGTTWSGGYVNPDGLCASCDVTL